MNTALWVVQILLSLLMIVLGLMKTFYPVDKLGKFAWTKRSSKAFIRFVGVSELVIGFGLILPQWTGILPVLTAYAALSLCMIMILAIAEHVKYREGSDIWKNVIIIFLAAFVALGRFIPVQDINYLLAQL